MGNPEGRIPRMSRCFLRVIGVQKTEDLLHFPPSLARRLERAASETTQKDRWSLLGGGDAIFHSVLKEFEDHLW